MLVRVARPAHRQQRRRLEPKTSSAKIRRTAVASYSALPEPMLARSCRVPTSGDYAYEVKWDGFRAIVSTEAALEVRSRRGWSMAGRLPELAGLPEGLVLADCFPERRAVIECLWRPPLRPVELQLFEHHSPL